MDETPDEEPVADPGFTVDQFQSRSRPKRELVWVYGIDQVRVCCID